MPLSTSQWNRNEKGLKGSMAMGQYNAPGLTHLSLRHSTAQLGLSCVLRLAVATQPCWKACAAAPLCSKIWSVWLSLNVLIRDSICVWRLGHLMWKQAVCAMEAGYNLNTANKNIWHSDHGIIQSCKAVLRGSQLRASCTGTLKCYYFQQKLSPCQTFVFFPSVPLSDI